LVLPGDKVRFADGDRGASVTLVPSPDYTFYFTAELLSSFTPVVGQSDAVDTLVDAFREDAAQYQVCLAKQPGARQRAKCMARGYGKDLAAFGKFLLDAVPARKGVWKLAKRLLDREALIDLLGNGDSVLLDADTLLSQGPLEVPPEDPAQEAASVVQPVTKLPTGELYVPYRQQLHARVPVQPDSWRVASVGPNGAYYLSVDGVLKGTAIAKGFARPIPSDLGIHTITTQALGLDGSPVRETYEYEVVRPSCSNCVIRDGNRTFTFVWDNLCPACTGDLLHYVLSFDASLPGTPGQFTSYLMNPELGWGCFEQPGDVPEGCAGVYQFGDYGWGVLPGESMVTMYFETRDPPRAIVPIGEWTVSVEAG
jgi:hypothetical protein